jgi:hypothetical protein
MLTIIEHAYNITEEQHCYADSLEQRPPDTTPGHWTAAVAQWVASVRGRGSALESVTTSHGNICESRAGGGRVVRWTGIATAVGLAGTHYRNRPLCREPDPLGTGLYALGTACAERELSAERSRHRWAGTGGSAESHGPNSRHSCAESPFSSRHRPVHN